LNDANIILFKRSEIALAKHSNNSHFSHLYVKLIYIYILAEQIKFGCYELIFPDQLFLTTKEHTQKFWHASSR